MFRNEIVCEIWRVFMQVCECLSVSVFASMWWVGASKDVSANMCQTVGTEVIRLDLDSHTECFNFSLKS